MVCTEVTESVSGDGATENEDEESLRDFLAAAIEDACTDSALCDKAQDIRDALTDSALGDNASETLENAESNIGTVIDGLGNRMLQ